MSILVIDKGNTAVFTLDQIEKITDVSPGEILKRADKLGVKPQPFEQISSEKKQIQGIWIGNEEFYNIKDVAEAFHTPAYHLLRRVRSNELNGQKFGTVYIVNAQSFRDWVNAGNFEYKRRKRRKAA